MSNATMWNLIIAGLLPLAVGGLIRASFAPWAKFLVATIVAAIVGVGTAWFSGRFTGLTVTQDVLTAILVTLGAYATVWKGTPLYNFFLHTINGDPAPH